MRYILHDIEERQQQQLHTVNDSAVFYSIKIEVQYNIKYTYHREPSCHLQHDKWISLIDRCPDDVTPPLRGNIFWHHSND